MERSKATEVTSAVRQRFLSFIEGCIPDLIDLSSEGGLYRDPDETDRDSIYDYAADRASDLFPLIDQEERSKLANYAADYFCGRQENLDQDEAFPIAGRPRFGLGDDLS